MIGELISHYRVLRQLGAGGMGVVYLTRDEQLVREVAIKLLSPGALADEPARQRFRNEAQLLAQLNHPNIEMVFEFGTFSGQEFLVLEYVPGQTLREVLSVGPLFEEKLLRLGSMLAAGLEAAHAKGILHRDLKPGNLILTPEGRLKILDFGLAVEQQTAVPGQDKRLAGTLPYMPPEQLRGEASDARSDIYSAGAVLYEMATGKPPFTSREPSELMDSILHETPAGPRQLNPNISSLCEALLLKAMQKAPGDRHQSAAELRGELERIHALRRPDATGRSLDQSQAPVLEMSYVLFMDIVGYSRLATDKQQSTLRQLQRVVRGTAEFQRAQAENRLIRLPTGDGMALAFFTDPEAPVRCAVQVSRALKNEAQQDCPEIPLRIGMHAGPVYRVTDINGNQNVAGEGINVAQRVMDCGDAGHLLVSKVLADVLQQLSGWTGALKDLGEVKVKHGLQIHIFNLLFEGAGNPVSPQKVQVQLGEARPKPVPMTRREWTVSGVASLLLLAVLALGTWRYFPRSTTPHTHRPTVAVLGFRNSNDSAEARWISTELGDSLTHELEAGNHVMATPGEDVVRAKRDLGLADDVSYGEDTVRRVHGALHCDYLVYGSFFAPGKAAGNMVQLRLRLQDAYSGEVLTSVSEDGTEAKLNEIAARAGAKLRTTLKIPSVNPDESDQIQADTPSENATKPYYAGLERLRNFDFLAARELLQKAVAADPNFAPAHARLAEAWIGLGYDVQAREEAQKAFDLSKRLPREEQLVVEARFREISSEWDKAVAIYQSMWTVYDNPEYALRAADAMIRAGRGNEALKTIKMLRGQPGPMATDPRLDLKEAEAYNSLGDFAHEKNAAIQAASKAQERGSRLLQAEGLWRACEASFDLGDAAGARPACDQAIAIAKPPLNDLLLLARATTILGHIAETQGNPAEALASHRQALEYARKIGSRRDITGALNNIAYVQSDQGDHPAAQGSLQEALAVAREINDQGQALTILNNLANESQLTGKFAVALRLYQQSLDTARIIHDKDGAGRALGNIGVIYSEQGNFAAALQNIQEAVKTAQETGSKSNQIAFLYSLGDTKLAQGDLAAAESDYQSGANLASQISDKSSIAAGRFSLGTLRLLQGKTAEALALGKQAAEEFHAEGMKDQESQASNLVAACLLTLNKTDEAEKEIEAAQLLSPQDPTVRMAVSITASRVALRKGKAVQGKKELESVAAESRLIGVPSIQFEARLAQGEIGLFGGDKRASLATLASLQQDASRKGYKQFEHRAKELAQQLSGSKPG